MKKFYAIFLSILIIFILLLGVSELPHFGKVDSPSNNYVSQRYIKNGVDETGALNIVTGIILDYRALDTFVESTVLFTSAILVICVLKT